MGSSRGPSTEVIQKPQRPIVTGTEYSRGYQMGQALLTDQLQADVNKAAENYFANANIGRALGEEYKPMSFGTFNYTSLLPSAEELAKQYDERIAKEQKQEEKQKVDESKERDKYLTALQTPSSPMPRMTGGG